MGRRGKWMRSLSANDTWIDWLRERRPKVILALGGVALRELTGLSGEKCGIGMTRGFIIPSLSYGEIPVVGSFHPSFLRRGSKEREEPRAEGEGKRGRRRDRRGLSFLGVLIRDLLLAQQVARFGREKFGV